MSNSVENEKTGVVEKLGLVEEKRDSAAEKRNTSQQDQHLSENKNDAEKGKQTSPEAKQDSNMRAQQIIPVESQITNTDNPNHAKDAQGPQSTGAGQVAELEQKVTKMEKIIEIEQKLKNEYMNDIHELKTENQTLMLEINRLSTQNTELHKMMSTSRYAGDDLQVNDTVVKYQFAKLKSLILDFPDFCDSGELDAESAKEISTHCSGKDLPISWDQLNVEQRDCWLRSLLANILHREVFQISFSTWENENIEKGLKSFEKWLFEETTGGTTPSAFTPLSTSSANAYYST